MKKQNGFTLVELVVVLAILSLLILGISRFVSSNVGAKSLGGTMTYELAPNTKLVNVTWKEDDLWVLTTARSASETPKTYEFAEKSALGILNGKVVLVEK